MKKAGMLQYATSNRALLASSAMALLFSGVFAPAPALAQALTANATTQSAFGAYSTTASSTGGYGFYVLNNGIINTSAAVTINTTGASAYGIYVISGGTVNIGNATSVTTTGTLATGIVVSSGTLTATAPVTITVTGQSAVGVQVSPTGTITMNNGGSISADSNYAVLANGAGASFTGQNLDISGKSTVATVQIITGATVSLTGGTITGWAGSNTVNGQGANASVTLKNLSITTLNNTPIGATAPSTPAAIGVYNGAYADADNLIINTYTNSGEGVAAVSGGTAIIRNSTISTYGDNSTAGLSGAGSAGIRAYGIGPSPTFTPSQVEVINTTITTNGIGSTGLESDDGGIVSMTGGSITVNNTDAQGLMTTADTAAGAALTGKITVNNVTISSAGDGIRVFGGGSDISLTGSTVTAGSGLVYNVEQNPNNGTPYVADAKLSADSSTLTGAMVTDAASTSHVTLTNHTLWNLTGNSNTTTFDNNNSTIDFSAPVNGVFKTLTVGSYVGGGGTIALNTVLAADGSPSDLLIINGGTATGLTYLQIKNANGGGALTTHDGIMVVQAQNGATTASDAFTLSGRVAAGAYEYTLFYGGDAASGGNPADQNWYLRSTVIPDDPVPNIRVEVPTVMVIPPLAIEYGYTMLSTMQDRSGEQRNDAGPVYEDRSVWCKGKNHNQEAVIDPQNRFKCIVRVPVAGKDGTRWAKSGWARLIGDHGIHDPDNFFRRGPDYSYTFGGVEAGLDVYARQHADGALDKAGVYIGYGQVRSDVRGQFGDKAGTVDMDAYTLGGYWTHLSPQGWYTDAVVQGTWYAADARSVKGQEIKPDGFGILGSLEGGYTFRFAHSWTLEPQAQIIYQNVSFDKAHDQYGNFSFDDGESLRGRLGLRLAKTWNRAEDGKSPRLVTAWVRANVWHEFLGDNKLTVTSLSGLNPVSFSSSLGGTWGEIGAGVTAQVTEQISLFANGAYNHSLDNRAREGWDGRLGAAVKW